jgi:hypothetical protein
MGERIAEGKRKKADSLKPTAYIKQPGRMAGGGVHLGCRV